MRKFSFFAAVLLLISCFTPSAHAAPSLSASAAVLIEATSGNVLIDVNAHTRMPMASTTKIMTAIVALEHTDVQKTVTVSENAVGIEGSSIYLKAGEQLTMEQLLYALLLESANDAAAAIAIDVAGDIASFSDMMNETAQKIGLTETHFTNPHGLDNEAHYTTAYDLALLARYALQNETFVKISSTYKTTIPMNGSEGTRVLVNHNKMLKTYDGAIGVKTGYTRRSGRCLVSAAERDGVAMIAVTLSAPDDWHDHTAMLDYGFSLYESVSLAAIGKYSCTLDCLGGDTPQITASNHTSLTVVLPKNHAPITVSVTANRPLCAPIAAGEKIGEILFLCGGEEIARLPLRADTDLNKTANEKTIKQKLKDFLRKTHQTTNSTMETKIRLQKFFTDAGILSRRACEAEILAGNITVNGKRAEVGMKIDPQRDTVLWNGKEIQKNSGSVSRTYILLNKPIGYVTTMSDEKGRQSVADLLADVGKRVYPIGRLDMYSDGLLLCTDDGDLANKLMHPSHDIAKTYIVTVKGHITEADAAQLTAPMELDGYRLRPVEVRLLSAHETMPDGTPVSQLEIILHEGRNRQIRRMCDTVGMKILRLRRVKEGEISLGSLPSGKWRHLTEEEINYLKSI